jgi:hypothetical protein
MATQAGVGSEINLSDRSYQSNDEHVCWLHSEELNSSKGTARNLPCAVGEVLLDGAFVCGERVAAALTIG